MHYSHNHDPLVEHSAAKPKQYGKPKFIARRRKPMKPLSDILRDLSRCSVGPARNPPGGGKGKKQSVTKQYQTRSRSKSASDNGESDSDRSMSGDLSPSDDDAGLDTMQAAQVVQSSKAQSKKSGGLPDRDDTTPEYDGEQWATSDSDDARGNSDSSSSSEDVDKVGAGSTPGRPHKPSTPAHTKPRKSTPAALPRPVTPRSILSTRERSVSFVANSNDDDDFDEVDSYLAG